ncbi:DUF461 domain-containing protein [Streptomyces coryli]|uniref:DUF461 domain-containing protein n=1 Tax=Streptomyces coryli TaxID=1128680 RepID=UPI0019D16EB1|nr:DUF461 domain-containing protein [Streptomyces coryli]
MSRSLGRGALAATAVVISFAALTACGAGNNAETGQINPDNARATVGDIQIQNAVVITPEERGEGTAAVSARIFNDGKSPERLTSLTIPETNTTVKLSGPKGGDTLTIPAGGSLMIGGKGNASAVIEGGRKSVTDGRAKQLVFQLSRTGAVKIATLVVPATGQYKSFGPSPAAADDAAGRGRGGASGSPSANPSQSPGAGQSADPSQTASGAAEGAGAASPSTSSSQAPGTGTSPEADGSQAGGH